MDVMNLYEQFLVHTKLSDATYKSVFMRVQDIIQSLNQIEFEKFKYGVRTESFSIDFNNLHEDVAPSYVVETIKNLFDKFFTFPKDGEIELDIKYGTSDFQATHSNGIITIPQQISFFEKLKVFPFFTVMDSPVDYYDEFDYLFKFLNLKDPARTIFGPLKEVFDQQTATEDVDSGEISPRTAASYSIMIEDLQDKKEKILKELEDIKASKDSLLALKNDLVQFAQFKDKYNTEYSTLVDEFNYLKEQKAGYLQKYSETLSLIDEINVTLAAMKDAETKDEAELKYLAERKVYFESRGTMLTNSIKELSGLQDTTKRRIEELQNIFKKTDKMSLEDLEDMSKQIDVLDKKQERLFANVGSIDNTIQQTKEAQANANITIERASYSDHVIQNAGNQTIPDHLAKPEIPTSVLVVKNYLRYYFVYQCEKKEKFLLTQKRFFSKPQVSRLVLKEYFGFEPKIIFSKHPIEGFNNVILVEG